MKKVGAEEKTKKRINMFNLKKRVRNQRLNKKRIMLSRKLTKILRLIKVGLNKHILSNLN